MHSADKQHFQDYVISLFYPTDDVEQNKWR